MIIFPDVGYTPANLKAFLLHKKWTQKQAAEFFGVSENCISQWCSPLWVKNHRDMPLKKWVLIPKS